MPIDTIVIDRRSCQHGRFAAAETQGVRVHHEDAHVTPVTVAVDGGDGTLLAVFDGHGSDTVSKMAVDVLPKHCRTQFSGGVDWVAAFLKADEQIRADMPGQDCGGSTAVACLIKESANGAYDIFVANLGDSRVLLIKQGSDASAVLATEDHKPDNPEEERRIVDAGGFVERMPLGPARLDGSLALSRALGDFSYKADPKREPKDQKCSVVPECYQWSASKGDAVFLACDGIFDVMSNQEVAQFVLDRMNTEEDVGVIVSGIIALALEKGSTDNLSAMVCILGASTEVEKHQEREIQHGKFPTVNEIHMLDAYGKFIQKAGFGHHIREGPQGLPNTLASCVVCHRTFQQMFRCSCDKFEYCSKTCQKIDWKKHRDNCPAKKEYGSPSAV